MFLGESVQGVLKAQCGPWVPRILVALLGFSRVPGMDLRFQGSGSLLSGFPSILGERLRASRGPSKSSGSGGGFNRVLRGGSQ